MHLFIIHIEVLPTKKDVQEWNSIGIIADLVFDEVKLSKE